MSDMERIHRERYAKHKLSDREERDAVKVAIELDPRWSVRVNEVRSIFCGK